MTVPRDQTEVFADAAHKAWMEAKRAQGIESRRSETGEELMVPYADLSEPAKDLDRNAVRAVVDAIHAAGYVIERRYLTDPDPKP